MKMTNRTMKIKIKICMLSLILFSVAAVSAQTADSVQHQKKILTEKYKVSGTCDQCKARIEKAAYKMKGVKEVNWDIDSKIFTVIYNSQKVTLPEIKNEILKVGYDVEDAKASDSSYSALPDCCKYREKGK